mmetsp:Transcript_37782/g.47672  ORF Transcript_37782/g.47672 Transcript_37782/m.47672 type:complete len:91 (-) Transcript_37782:1383-1655(-)
MVFPIATRILKIQKLKAKSPFHATFRTSHRLVYAVNIKEQTEIMIREINLFFPISCPSVIKMRLLMRVIKGGEMQYRMFVGYAPANSIAA